jgi:hypothetical protein
MYKLSKANVHYGIAEYPLNGLPAKYDQIAGVEDLTTLREDVGRITSYHRDFKISHIMRTELPGIKDTATGKDIVITEHIYAGANGYSLTWEKM